MKKRQITIALVIVFCLTLFPVQTVVALSGTTEDGWVYATHSIPNGYSSIFGMSIVRYTGSEEHVTVPKTVPYGSVKFIGASAFTEADHVKSVILPPDLYAILATGFYGCESLEKVTFTGGCGVYDMAFANCSSLKEINLPATMIRIEDRAFENCVSLTSILLPSSVREIKEKAFMGCTALTSISFPYQEQFTCDIEANAFTNCTSLKTIYFRDFRSSIAEDAFTNVTATVYYDAKDPYLNESKMKDYGGNLTWVALEQMPQHEAAVLGEYPVDVPTTPPETVVSTETFAPAQTEPTTEKPTEPSTEEPTEPSTEEPTESTTEEPTEPFMEEPTESTTEEPTEPSTEEPTESTTEEPTEPSTVESTELTTEGQEKVSTQESINVSLPAESDNHFPYQVLMWGCIFSVILGTCVVFLQNKRKKNHKE